MMLLVILNKLEENCFEKKINKLFQLKKKQAEKKFNKTFSNTREI